jgi:hypothetical protein
MSRIKGTEVLAEELYGCHITTLHIQSRQAATSLNKPVGSYITIDFGESLNVYTKKMDIGECLAAVLQRIMKPYYHKKLCICGIGNRGLPIGALGPEVTYNLPTKLFARKNLDGNFCEVFTFETGTEWSTNIRIAKAIGADCILLVDSLITKNPSQLFHTIQVSMSDKTDFSLSGRVGDWSVLGIPVIALGMPVAISSPIFSSERDIDSELITGNEMQAVIASAGQIIAYAILRICWPLQSQTECVVLSGLNRNFR